MKKLLLFTLCCFLAQVSYGQIVEFNFNSSTLAPSAINASLTATNLIVSTGTISTGIITGTYFTDEPYIQSNAGWGEATSSTAKELCTTITIAAGYQLDITNIAYDAYATGAGPSATSFSIGAAGYLTSGTNLTSALLPINESITDQNNLSGTVTVCIQAWDNGSRTTSGGGDFRMDNFIITGLVTPLVVTPDRFEISSALPITAGVGNPFTVEVCATDGTSTDASYSTDIVLTDNASTATYTVSPSNTVTPTTGCATFTITPTSTGNINLDFGNADFTNQQASTVVYSIATPGNIVINEVSPDPGNGEGGNGEFIELFCNGTDACDIGCMVVATDDNNIFTIPSGTLVLPGEIFLIGKSSGLSCATCDFPGLTLDLDLDACADCGSSSSLSYDNGTSNTANGDGQRIVLFGEAGAIVNAMSYCSQAGADIQESNCIGTYDNDPDGCGPLFGSSNSGGVCDPISGGSPAGTQPEGFAYTYGDTAGGCSSFDIPNPGGLCSHSTSGVTLPAIGDAAYEYANFCIQGCSSSIARDTDGSTTWKEDNSPTPGLPNNSANGYINTSADNGVEPPTTTTDYNQPHWPSGAGLGTWWH